MKRWMAFGILAALLLAGCGGNPAQLPGQQLSQNDDALYGAGQPLLDEAAAAFSDLMPQGLAPQQTASPRNLTMTKDSAGNIVLIGGPWRPPFPFPLPPVDKPLSLVIKHKSSQASQRREAYLGMLRRQPETGSYIVEWHGAKGTQPIQVPATVVATGDISGNGKFIPKFSYNPKTDEWDIIIIITLDNKIIGRMHITAPLPPDTLPGRPLQGTLDTAPYEGKFKEVCCGWPKPFPPQFPPIWLHREDLSLVVAPYDNPKLSSARNIEELVGQNLGLAYVRRKPDLPGTTTDCGPNRVWCPPDTDPFLNLKLGKNPDGTYALLLTSLSDPNKVIATLPAEVSWEPDRAIPSHIGIEDRLAGDNIEIKIEIKMSGLTITATIKF